MSDGDKIRGKLSGKSKSRQVRDTLWKEGDSERLQCYSQILEFLQGLLWREHIDQTDDLQAERQNVRQTLQFYLPDCSEVSELSLTLREKKKTLSSGNIYFHRNKFKRKVLQQIKEALTLSTKIRPYY